MATTASIKARIEALERSLARTGEPLELVGVIDMEPGQSPELAIESAAPSIWFVHDAVTDAGYLGLVYRSGRREIHGRSEDHGHV